MKNLNSSPFAWFVLVVLVGWLLIESQSFEYFVLAAAALITAKQIEILNCVRQLSKLKD